jgi:hypothetical protein
LRFHAILSHGYKRKLFENDQRTKNGGRIANLKKLNYFGTKDLIGWSEFTDDESRLSASFLPGRKP